MDWSKADLDSLATHWKYDEKLPYDVLALIPHLHCAKRVWDAAAGTDRICRAMERVFIDCEFVRSDINDRPGILLHDLGAGKLPVWCTGADVVLLLGVIQFLTDDRLRELFGQLAGRKVIVRSPCPDQRVSVDKYSDELRCRYRSEYRTAGEISALYPNGVQITSVYPSHLESKHGTVQRLFVGVA